MCVSHDRAARWLILTDATSFDQIFLESAIFQNKA